MGIEEFFKKLSQDKKEKSERKKLLENEISELELNPLIKEYNTKKDELSLMEGNNNLYISYNEIVQEDNHPLFVFQYDLCSLRHVIPCARCLVCDKVYYEDEVDFDELYKNKRLIAKKTESGYGYIDYKLTNIELKRLYIHLLSLSENNTKFNAEDYLFDHLTNNNPNVIYTGSYNNKPGVHINEQEFWNEFRQMLSENPKLLEVDEKGMVRTKKKSYNHKSN